MASCSQPPPPPPAPAIRSQPSDVELVKMLRALVDPNASPPSNLITIHEADVYAQDPVDLTERFPPTIAEDGQKVWYFSTKLLPKNQRGKRKRRCMDSGGVWHDEGKSKAVGVGGSEARRYLFSFMVDGARTGWINHEFRLPVVPDGNEESQVVLCKVFRSSRWCPANPAGAAAEVQAEAQAQAQAQAEAEVEVAVEEEARVNAVEARVAAVKVREEALPAREAAVAEREAAVAARDAADLQERQSDLAAVLAAVAAVEAREAEVAARGAADLQERQSDLAARVAALVAAVAELEGEAPHRRVPSFLALDSLMLIRMAAWSLLQTEWEAELAREAELREAESEALARREAARLAEWERSLQERERNLEAREFESLQEMEAYLMSDEEALVLIMMAAAALVARAGMRLLLPIAGGSRPAVAHCGGALEPLF